MVDLTEAERSGLAGSAGGRLAGNGRDFSAGSEAAGRSESVPADGCKAADRSEIDPAGGGAAGCTEAGPAESMEALSRLEIGLAAEPKPRT